MSIFDDDEFFGFLVKRFGEIEGGLEMGFWGESFKDFGFESFFDCNFYNTGCLKMNLIFNFNV